MTDAGLVCALPDRSAAADVRKYQDALVIREILHTARTIAIVGLSSNVLRPSYFVGFYLQRHGYRIGAGALWLQSGVISPQGAQTAEQGGLQVVVDRCMKVEHARHMGRMHWLGFNTGVVGAQRQSVL